MVAYGLIGLLAALGAGFVLARRFQRAAPAPDSEALETENRRLRELLGDTRQLLRRMQGSYLASITSMARIVEAKDPFAGDHTDQLVRIASALGARLGFAGADLRAIEMGATVHDIGTIGVTDVVLHKEGRLDPREADTMRRHTVMGAAILADLEIPAIVKEMVRSHHERFDGTGYPDGLKGEKIPLAARVLAVADALDAMLSERPYRPAMSFVDAYEEIMGQRGTQFCPQVVDALASCWREDPMFWTDERHRLQDPALELPASR
jgi:putative nucleotidyltransferase with HDIG domain